VAGLPVSQLRIDQLRAGCYFADDDREKDNMSILRHCGQGRTLLVHRCIECHTLPLLLGVTGAKIGGNRRQHVASFESETCGTRSDRRLYSRGAIR